MKISKNKLNKMIQAYLFEAVPPGASLVTTTDGDRAYLPGTNSAPIPPQKGKLKNGSKLSQLDQKAKSIKDFVNDLVKLGYEISVNSCWRSMGKQADLYKKYAGKRDADVAPPGGSPHNYGLGIDINIYYKDKEGNKVKLGLDSSNEEWLRHIDNNAISYKDYQLEWGGNFPKRDAIHFDVYPITVGEMKIRRGGYGSKSMWERDAFEKKLSKKAVEKGLPLDSLYSEIIGT